VKKWVPETSSQMSKEGSRQAWAIYSRSDLRTESARTRKGGRQSELGRRRPRRSEIWLVRQTSGRTGRNQPAGIVQDRANVRLVERSVSVEQEGGKAAGDERSQGWTVLPRVSERALVVSSRRRTDVSQAEEGTHALRSTPGALKGRAQGCELGLPEPAIEQAAARVRYALEQALRADVFAQEGLELGLRRWALVRVKAAAVEGGRREEAVEDGCKRQRRVARPRVKVVWVGGRRRGDDKARRGARGRTTVVEASRKGSGSGRVSDVPQGSAARQKEGRSSAPALRACGRPSAGSSAVVHETRTHMLSRIPRQATSRSISSQPSRDGRRAVSRSSAGGPTVAGRAR